MKKHIVFENTIFINKELINHPNVLLNKIKLLICHHTEYQKKKAKKKKSCKLHCLLHF